MKLQTSGRVKFTAEKVKFVQFDSTGMGPIGGTSVPFPEGGVIFNYYPNYRITICFIQPTIYSNPGGTTVTFTEPPEGSDTPPLTPPLPVLMIPCGPK